MKKKRVSINCFVPFSFERSVRKYWNIYSIWYLFVYDYFLSRIVTITKENEVFDFS